VVVHGASMQAIGAADKLLAWHSHAQLA
jgi:hypothetical protein